MKADNVAPKSRSRSRALKIVVSLLLITHFAAVLLAGFGAGTFSHPAPLPLAIAHDYMCGYLRVVLLDMPWHFYAPNPGRGGVLYVSIETNQQRQIWQEWPGNTASPYLESSVRLSGASTMLAKIEPAFDRPGEYVISESSEIALSSATRRFVRNLQPFLRDGEEPVHVAIYLLSGAPMTPQQAAHDWKFGDLRLYDAISVGNFSPEGKRFHSLPSRNVETASFALGIVQALRKKQRLGLAPDGVTLPQTPHGVQVLLEDNPEWLTMSDDELRVGLLAYFSPEVPESRP